MLLGDAGDEPRRGRARLGLPCPLCRGRRARARWPTSTRPGRSCGSVARRSAAACCSSPPAWRWPQRSAASAAAIATPTDRRGSPAVRRSLLALGPCSAPVPRWRTSPTRRRRPHAPVPRSHPPRRLGARSRGRRCSPRAARPVMAWTRAGSPGRGPSLPAWARRPPTSTCRPAACRSPTRHDAPTRHPPAYDAADRARPGRLRRLARRPRRSRRRRAGAARCPTGCARSPSTAPAATRSLARGGIVTGAVAPPLQRADAAPGRRGDPRRALPDAALRPAPDRPGHARLDRPLRRLSPPAGRTTAAAGASATSARSPKGWSRGSWPSPRCSSSRG